MSKLYGTRFVIASAMGCLLALGLQNGSSPAYASSTQMSAGGDNRATRAKELPSALSAQDVRTPRHRAKNHARVVLRGGGLAVSSGRGGKGSKANQPSSPTLVPTPDLSGRHREFQPTVADVVRPYEYNGDVRNLPPAAPRPEVEVELQEPFNYKSLLTPQGLSAHVSPQADSSSGVSNANLPTLIQSFDGLSFSQTVSGGQVGAGWPPDTNGDVGPNHYIIAVNDAWGIYSKTGTLIAAFTENQLWNGAGSGTPCDSLNFGDPVVLYDSLADRFILTNFAFNVVSGNPVAPFYQCYAVSKTGDPVSGGWWLYAVRMDPGGPGFPPVGTLNDYPKFGVWTDCIYVAANGFQFPSASYNGSIFGWLNKSDMYAGAPLRSSLGFIPYAVEPVFTLIPTNINGRTPQSLPPPDRSNYFVSESLLNYSFEVRAASPGANCQGGTLGAAVNVTQAPYTVPNQNIVPQPNDGGMHNLDSLGDRMMQRAQYRKVNSSESLWVVHTTQIGSTTRPQWAQLDVTGGTVATIPVQEQIYSPDATLFRWMGSIAADSAGDAGLGYSTSNQTAPNFPSIAFSGRLITDPLNTLPQGETQIIAGLGSQQNNCGGAPCHRWGDYSSMSVDPGDDCTFWYSNEYYDTQASGTAGNWHTRIGALRFSSCAPVSVDLTIFKTHSGNFNPGANGTYTVTAQNVGTANSLGTVTATETLPSGLSLVSMDGPGWTCSGAVCTRSDPLAPSNSYPDITVVVLVAPDAPSMVTNTVTVSGGNDANPNNNTATDPTSINANSVAVTIDTAPSGLALTVDGTNYSAPQTFNWAPGSSHGIATSSPQAGDPGVQYAFTSWSDGGAISHTITVPSVAATYTASFDTQYQLTTAVAPDGDGTVSPASGNFYSSGATLSLTATANAGFMFVNWTGDVADPNAMSTTIVMSGPESVIANFAPTASPSMVGRSGNK